MNDGTKHDAEFVASDVNTDVAVIKIKDVQDLVNDYNKDIDNIYKDKEKELMTV